MAEDKLNFGNMFGSAALMLGPALMARGFNMPALGMMGPVLMKQQQQAQQMAAERKQQQAAEAAEALARAQWQQSVGAEGPYESLNPEQRAVLAGMPRKEGRELLGKWLTPQKQPAPQYGIVPDRNSPTGFRYVQKQIGGAAMPPSGMSVTVGPDGGFQMVQGPGAGMGRGVTTTTQSAVEGKAIDAATQLSRLQMMEEGFDPKWLTFKAQADQAASALQERLGIPLSEEGQANLEAYTTFKSDTLNNLNRTLNELSGAAVNEQEFKRIKAMLPTLEDSPTEYRTKLSRAAHAMRQAIWRHNYAQKTGQTPWDVVTLDGVDELMQKELGQPATARRAPGQAEAAAPVIEGPNGEKMTLSPDGQSWVPVE